MTAPIAPLVSPSDIAELASVSRAAVSNWQRREGLGFPQPTGGTETNPLFSLDAVSAWLVDRGYDIVAASAQARIWGALNTLRGVLQPEDAALVFVALACVRRAEPDLFRDRTQRSSDPLLEVRQAIRASPMLTRLIGGERVFDNINDRAVSQLASIVWEIDDAHLAEVVDALLARTARAQVRRGGESGYVGSPISRMLSALALARKHLDAAYDPACGIGTTLVSIGRRAGRPVALVGQELAVDAAHVAMQRAYLWGVEIDVLVGDTMVLDAAPGFNADVVVAEPPFGVRFDVPSALGDPRFQFGLPSRSSADLAWVQHCIAHLTADGIAYVVTPHGPLFRAGAERAIRMELVSRGCVRAIVGLPGKLHPHTPIELAVWVVQRPRPEHQQVLLIDGSADADAPDRVAVWLDGDAVDIEVPHRLVDIAELLADDALLAPRRWIEMENTAPADVAESFRSGVQAAKAVIAANAETLEALVQPAPPSAARMVTIDQIVQQGAAKLAIGRADARVGDLVAGTVSASDVRNGSLGERAVNSAVELTEPGDVLVVTWNRISAVVDREGGRRLGNGVHRLRISAPDLVLPEYLAAVLSGSWNDRFFGGTSIKRANVRHLEVPLIPLAEQRAIATRLEATEALRRQAEQLTDLAERIGGAQLDALRYGIALDAADEPPGAESREMTRQESRKDHTHGLD